MHTGQLIELTPPVMAGRGATLSLACASANICGLLAFPCESLRFSAPPLCCAVRSRWPEPNRAEFSTLRWMLLRSIRPSEIPRRRGELLELLEKERRDTRVKRQITRTIFLFSNIYLDNEWKMNVEFVPVFVFRRRRNGRRRICFRYLE